MPHSLRSLKEFQQCDSVLNDLVGLCERNSHSTIGEKKDDLGGGHMSSKAESNNEKLWFTLLDFVLEHKHKSREQHAGDQFSTESIQTVLADFVHVILTHLNGRVSLHAVLAKITSDHKDQEFREFRSTITGMLENVRYEQKILQTAKQLLADAKYRQVYELHRGQALHIEKIDMKNVEMERTMMLAREEEDGEAGGEDYEAKTRMTQRFRRVQKARRRDRKAHPPRVEKDDDEEEEFAESGGVTIKYGRHVLELR